MKITALKAQVKNADRVSVFVEGKYSFSLTLDQVIEHKVVKGLELDEAGLAVMKKLSADGKLQARAYEWLMGRPHSTREFRDYLRRKKAEQDLIDAFIILFTDKGILDDARFADWFSERAVRKHKSQRMLRGELAGKGIAASSLRPQSLENEHNDQTALAALLLKLANRPRYADQARLIRYLQGKGFSYGDIKQALMLREPEQEP